MIGSLRGTVLERDLSGWVLIEVSGVGYVVNVTHRTLAELEPSTQAFLYVHHHIREDAQSLFGFPSRDERLTFASLIAAHGVGPSLAMAILATHAPNALVDIVANGDVAALTLVPGIGKKTAERLLIELKSSLHVPVLEGVGMSGGGGSSVLGDVREALLGLGYGDGEVRDTLRELPSSSADAATLLRDALKLLGARRAG
jgi:Holliday junction DNA helicase RuvA